MAVLIPIIKVKDKYDETEHIVGTDTHDELIIENNAIHYRNVQCMEGTQYNGAYQFVGVEGNEYDPDVTVQFVTLEEFVTLYETLDNADVAQEEHLQKRLQDFLKKVLDNKEKIKSMQRNDAYIKHT